MIFQNVLKKRRIRRRYGREKDFQNVLKKRRIRRHVLFSNISAKNDF